MDNKELLRRLALLKANPKLAETIPQAEVFKMIQDVISAFNVLKTAIDNGKIKGEAGYTPIPDVDYPSLTRYDKSIEETITALETNYAYALDAIEKKLATVKDGEDGSDAVITDEDKSEIAGLAYNLITLPNFEELVASEIPRHGEAIRNALELLQGDERYKVEIADVQGLQEEINRLYQVRGATQAGGVSRNTVIDLIAQYGGGAGVPDGGTTGQVLTKLSNADGDADWQDPSGGSGAVDSVNGQTGVVVLDGDDIDDTSSTNKFTTASDISKLAGIEAGADVTDATNVAAAGAFMKAVDDTDDITEGATNKFATAAEKTKLGHISVTQAVDLDAMESDIATNNAKVSNATHTGEVTGSGALTVDKTAITNKTTVTVDGADYVLISDASDSGNLKKVLASDLAGGGSGITRSVTVTSGNVSAGSTAATDYVYFVAGAHTVSLPAASGNTNLYTIKNNHSANITVDTVGAETLDGTASISLAPEESVQIISDGTNYFIV